MSELREDLVQMLRRHLPLLQRLFGIDARALAVLRIGIGILLLYDLYDRSRDITMFLNTLGALTSPSFFISSYSYSLHTASLDPAWLVFVFCIHAAVALAVVVGYRTTFATIIAFVLTVSLHNSNLSINFGEDTILRLMLFFGMFVAWGSACSFDALQKKSNRRSNIIVSPWTAALLVQIAAVYFFSGLNKSGLEWKDGSAVALTITSSRFGTHAGHWLASLPGIPAILTYAVVWFQRSVPFLLFAPIYRSTIRVITIGILALMHLGFFTFMVLGWFPFVCIVMLVVYVPSGIWDRLERQILSLTGRAFNARLLDWSFEPRSPNFASNILMPLNRGFSYVVFATAFLYLGVMMTGNIADIARIRDDIPGSSSWTDKIERFTGTTQRLGFFSPRPPLTSEWPVVVVTWSDGVENDAANGWRPVDWNIPTLASDRYGSPRLSKLLYVVKNSNASSAQKRGLALVLCEEAKKHASPPRVPVSTDVYFVSVSTSTGEVVPRQIYKAECPSHTKG